MPASDYTTHKYFLNLVYVWNMPLYLWLLVCISAHEVLVRTNILPLVVEVKLPTLRKMIGSLNLVSGMWVPNEVFLSIRSTTTLYVNYTTLFFKKHNYLPSLCLLPHVKNLTNKYLRSAYPAPAVFLGTESWAKVDKNPHKPPRKSTGLIFIKWQLPWKDTKQASMVYVPTEGHSAVF